MNSTLRFVKLDSIICDDRHRSVFGDLETLAESIKNKGVIQPVTVAPDLRLLAGERRVRAAKAAGLEEIPALVREIDGEIDAREIELFENVHRKNFEWFEEVAIIRDIDRLYKEKEQDWSGRKTAQLLEKGVATVARAIQLANAVDVIPELAKMSTADDALKTIKNLEEDAIVSELRSRQTDPENTYYNSGIQDALRVAERSYVIGDTFQGLAELPTGGKVGLIECDPPYGINLNAVKSSKDTVGNLVSSYNEVPAENYREFLLRLAKELFRVASHNCWLVFWFGPTWHSQVYAALEDAGWLVDDIPCIWVKSQGQTLQPELYLGRAYEPFFMARKGKPVIMQHGRLNVFNYSGLTPSQKIHPTERPVSLIEDILRTLVPPATKILVPFLGSGATIRAAFNLGLSAMGWEINGEYRDRFMLAIERDSRELLDIPKEA
jgi:ParB/RepB/Spo0J family partition protein